jgi:hypothetical protein
MTTSALLEKYHHREPLIPRNVQRGQERLPVEAVLLELRGDERDHSFLRQIGAGVKEADLRSRIFNCMRPA